MKSQPRASWTFPTTPTNGVGNHIPMKQERHTNKSRQSCTTLPFRMLQEQQDTSRGGNGLIVFHDNLVVFCTNCWFIYLLGYQIMPLHRGDRVQCTLHIFRHYGTVRKTLQDEYESHDGNVYVVEWDRNYSGHHSLHEYVTSDMLFETLRRGNKKREA